MCLEFLFLSFTALFCFSFDLICYIVTFLHFRILRFNMYIFHMIICRTIHWINIIQIIFIHSHQRSYNCLLIYLLQHKKEPYQSESCQWQGSKVKEIWSLKGFLICNEQKFRTWNNSSILLFGSFYAKGEIYFLFLLNLCQESGGEFTNKWQIIL